VQSPLRQIRSLASIRAGYQTRSGIAEAANGSHFLLQIRDFNESRTAVNLSDLTKIEPGAINPAQVLQDGDVLFLAKGSRNFAHALKAVPALTLAASYFFILRPEAALLPEYLAWFLNLESSRRVFTQSTGHAAHMPVVRRDVIESLEIPLPSLQRQQEVVELDRLMRRQQVLLLDLASSQRTLFTEACVLLAHQQSPTQ
jgi:hypothetical protein